MKYSWLWPKTPIKKVKGINQTHWNKQTAAKAIFCWVIPEAGFYQSESHPHLAHRKSTRETTPSLDLWLEQRWALEALHPIINKDKSRNYKCCFHLHRLLLITKTKINIYYKIKMILIIQIRQMKLWLDNAYIHTSYAW